MSLSPLFFFLLIRLGQAQSAGISGGIAGQVLDPAGSAAPGIPVAARNVDTNLRRETVTDNEGRFAFSSVPLGAYEVTANPSGLASSTRQVYVSLGEPAAANFKLGLNPVRESIDVVADADGIDLAKTSSRAVLTDIQLRNLPANGRRIRGMFLLTPATQIEPECGGFAVSGQKGLFTNINVDGGDYTNVHWCGHVEFSPSFSLEAVQEFQVMRSTFSAEYGRSTGGFINLATKSGTNEFHGSGFYLFRDRHTTALDPFGREQLGLGQQFGGSAGGPLRRDRTFFFSAAEFQENNKPVQVLYTQLDTQNLRSTPGGIELLRAAPEDSLTAISSSRSVINRIDHHLNEKHTIMGRFDYIRNRVTDTTGPFIMTNGIGADSITNRSVQNASPVNDRQDVAGMGQLTSVLSSRHVNEVRVQIVREFRPWDPGAGPEVTVRNGSPIQTIAIYGPQATGLGYGNIGYRFTDVRYQFIDNVSIVSGAHTARFGFDSNTVQSNTTFNPGWNGIYRFDSLADYVGRRPAQYTQFAGTGQMDAAMHQIAFYLQDEWRVHRRLTISPGLRYEMAILPNYRPATVPENRFPLASDIPSDRELIAPRLGMAWDLRGDSKTVVRAAAGLFYAPPYMPLFEQAILGNGGNPELSSSVTLNGSADVRNAFQSAGIGLAAAPLAALPSFTGSQLSQLSSLNGRVAGQTVYFFDPRFRLPRSAQLRAAVEQRIAEGVTLEADFTNINVARIDRIRDVNLPAPVPDATGRPVFRDVKNTKPFPMYGMSFLAESSARSLYHGATATLNVRRRKFTASATYTLGASYSHDDHERGISGANYDNAYNLANEYSYSNIDQRHQFAGTWLYFAPFGFEFSATARFNSGRPFSALTGADSNGDGVLRDRPVINGEVQRRNMYRNTGFSDVSTRAQRAFKLPNDRARIFVTAEVFNVFNFDNVEIGAAQMTYGAGPLPGNPNFGRLRDPRSGDYFLNSTLRTAPLQAQLGMRLQF